MKEQAVVDIITKILSFYRYNVTHSEIANLLAEKGEEHLFVKFEPQTNIISARNFQDNVKSNFGNGLLISESFDEKTKDFAMDEGLTLLDRTELELWIGHAVLSGALSEQLEISPETEQDFDLSVIAPVREELEKTIRLSLPSIPINIGKEEAMSVARTKIGMVKNVKLIFTPVWYYHYSFSSQKKYQSKKVELSGEGGGQINAMNGENSLAQYTDILDNTFVPTQYYEIIEPEVEKKDAENKAIEIIIRNNSKEERINEMIGDTIIFEHKVFAPDREDIELEMELLYIPVWEIESRNKILEINGYSGQLKEKSSAQLVEIPGINNRHGKIKKKVDRSKYPYDDAEFV